MEELIPWIIISGLLFVAFIVLIGLGVVKQNKNLVIISIGVIVICSITSGITVYKFVTKSYTRIADYLEPRSGEEIYKALFGKPQTDCVSLLQHQDQVVPKMDVAIFLHFKTCPQELKRIVSRQAFEEKRVAVTDISVHGPAWFTPDKLQDTVIIYSSEKEAKGTRQTIYSNLGRTEAYCVDASE